MTPDAQRIAIATACGWIQHGDEGIYGCWDDPKGLTRSGCPDYTSDLNAMHEAEKTLTSAQMAAYAAKLNRTTPLGGWLFVATAAQRAKAFLLTLKLWEETPHENRP